MKYSLMKIKNANGIIRIWEQVAADMGLTRIILMSSTIKYTKTKAGSTMKHIQQAQPEGKEEKKLTKKSKFLLTMLLRALRFCFSLRERALVSLVMAIVASLGQPLRDA